MGAELMKSVMFKGVDSPLAVEYLGVPEPGPKQIQIKVRACGICGSDLHFTQNPNSPKNVVLGHEFSGEVVKAGSDVKRWSVGDRVVPLAMTTCGTCENCVTGRNFYCRNGTALGFNPDYNGAYSEYVVVGEHDAIRLPAGVSYAEGATVEPLAVGYDAVRKARLAPSESVLIIGAGPIGLCIATWARHFGAPHVVVSERVSSRLDVAMQMGATATIDASEEKDVMAAFKRMTGTRPAVIFEAVGVPGMIQQCVDMARPESRIVVVGVCAKPDTFKPSTCIHKRLELIFTLGYSIQDFESIVTFLSQKRINVAPMIRHRISLEEVPDTVTAMYAPTDQVKVIIEPAGPGGI